MSSISSPLTSQSASSPVYFTGMSNYSSDLNNTISQEVQLASLPIQLLQNNVNDLTNQSSEMQKLSTAFSGVQTAVANLATAAAQPLSAISSNSAAVSATASSGVAAASYSIEVDNLGSYSDALSLDTGLPTVTSPGSQSISSASTYTLTVGTQTYTGIRPSADNLNALAQAINSAGAGVQATVINVSSGPTADYRLSLQSTQLGGVSMQLNDGSRNLLSSTQTGQPVSYILNGKSLTSGSRTLALATGLTVNLNATNVGNPATVTVAATTSGISNALSSFATAYNSAVDELNTNFGQAGGALAGQGIVYSLYDSLESLANYATGTDGLTSLNSLGLKFADTTGHLTFDPTVLAAAGSGQSQALAQFLGSPTTGGFLETATNVLTGIEDPTTGSLTAAMNATISEISSVNQQISDKQDQVNQLQQNLTQQMAAADALIASTQQQATMITSMFQAMQVSENMFSSTGSSGTA